MGHNINITYFNIVLTLPSVLILTYTQLKRPLYVMLFYISCKPYGIP
jgi:hypothetical protein